MRINKLRVNHLENPIGFLLEHISLSWITEDTKGKYQEFAQVLVSTDENFTADKLVFDSEKKSNINSLDYEIGIDLLPYTRYHWKVLVWADNGDFAESETAFFETGKLNESWEAKWITPSLDKDVHPLLRNNFTIEKEIKSARAYVCGLGIYEFEVNGEKVGNEYLLPGFNSYDFYLQYQTYDITKYLKQGENAVGAILGNGWYKGRIGFDGGYTELYGDKFAFICEIRITLEDGTVVTKISDESWKCHKSPVVSSGIYDGEVYDANQNISNWSLADCDVALWEKVNLIDIGYEKLTPRINLPIVIKEKINPVKLIHTPKDEYVLDFGQIITGWVEFNVNVPKNKEVKLQYGEIMQNDVFYNENLRTAKAEFVYISDGNEKKVRPHFTFYGFRYVKIEGIENINLNDFVGCVVMSDIDKVGNIETSNPMVNKLFENALWSQKDNFLDIPTDCPQRDERMGWTGDAQIFASTACYNMYTPGFYTKFLYDLKYEQEALNGSIPFFVPLLKPEKPLGWGLFLTESGSCAWGDVATVLPWTLYEHYGDKSLLRNQYNIMKSWVDYIKRSDDNDGSKRLWHAGSHLGDWLALDNINKDSPLGATDENFIACAYYYYSTTLTAKAAKVLGKEEDEKYYGNLAREIKEAIKNEYFSPNGKITVNTQTAMIISLFMDFVPEEFRERVTVDLKKKIEKNNMHLDTGFVGTPYICRALSDNGANDYAYTLLLNDDFPSWLYEVKMGATTIWERWNSVLEDGSISGTGMNSLNHYAYGSIVDWMYRNMCGINPVEGAPGFKKVIIKPEPDKRISYAKADFNSPAGYYESSWKINEDEAVEYTFEIPFDAEATVILSNMSQDNIYVNGEQYKAEKVGDKLKLILNAGRYEIR